MSGLVRSRTFTAPSWSGFSCRTHAVRSIFIVMSRNAKSPRLDATRYRGQWVALHPDTRRVIAHSASLKAARRAAAKLGEPEAILYAVPKSDAYFVG